LSGQPLFHFLLQVAILLVTATGLGILARRLSLPALVGELLAGILLGPSLLGHAAPQLFLAIFPQNAEQVHMLDSFGQIGVVLLVAITGLQLDLSLVRRRSATAVRVSLPGFIIPLGLGLGVGALVPASLLTPNSDRVTFAVFIGIAMSVSAIPVIAKTLIDLKLLHRNVGQLILMAGTVDDLIGWIGLSVVTAMATTGLRAGHITAAVVYLIAVVVIAAFIGRPIVRTVMRATTRSAEPGVTIAAAVSVVVLCSVVTHLLNLESIFGALVAGILLRTAGPEVAARLKPLRTIVTAVLAPIFFATAGLRMDLFVLARPNVLATAVVLLAIAILGKFSGAFIGARLSYLNWWEATALGAGMNARGVVEVVVAMVGVRLGVLSTAMYTGIVLIAVVTSLMGPPILRYSMARLEITAEERLREAENEPAPLPIGGSRADDAETR
jgi:Kef-type K+ transport system membrane component KefB